MPTQKITREKLLAESIRTFREKGYYGTSMHNLAVGCGLTKGAFYHHFTNKEAVMKACLEFAHDWFEKHVFAIAYQQGSPAKNKMEDMAEKLLRTFAYGEGGCFFANTALETLPVQGAFRAQLVRFFKMWEDAITHLLMDTHTESEARSLSLQSIADIEGSIMLMQLHQDVRYLEQSIQRCTALL